MNVIDELLNEATPEQIARVRDSMGVAPPYEEWTAEEKLEYNRTGATPEREEPLSIRDAVLTVITGFPPKLAALDMMKCAETGKIFISKDLFVSAIAEFTKDMDYLYKTSDMERSRIEGILLGLSLAKSAWDKDLGRSDIVENELYYQEELVRLNKDGKPS